MNRRRAVAMLAGLALALGGTTFAVADDDEPEVIQLIEDRDEAQAEVAEAGEPQGNAWGQQVTKADFPDWVREGSGPPPWAPAIGFWANRDEDGNKLEKPEKPEQAASNGKTDGQEPGAHGRGRNRD